MANPSKWQANYVPYGQRFFLDDLIGQKEEERMFDGQTNGHTNVWSDIPSRAAHRSNKFQVGNL